MQGQGDAEAEEAGESRAKSLCGSLPGQGKAGGARQPRAV